MTVEYYMLLDWWRPLIFEWKLPAINILAVLKSPFYFILHLLEKYQANDMAAYGFSLLLFLFFALVLFLVYKYFVCRHETHEHKKASQKQYYWNYIALGYGIRETMILDLYKIEHISEADRSACQDEIHKQLSGILNNARHEPDKIVYYTETVSDLVDYCSAFIKTDKKTNNNDLGHKLGFVNYWRGIITALESAESFIKCSKHITLTGLTIDTRKYFKALYDIEKKVEQYQHKLSRSAVKENFKSKSVNFDVSDGKIGLLLDERQSYGCKLKNGQLFKLHRKGRSQNMIIFTPFYDGDEKSRN
jgi:uncharacterized protein with PQ loop repeat